MSILEVALAKYGDTTSRIPDFSVSEPLQKEEKSDEHSEPFWMPPKFDEVAALLGCHDCNACYHEWCGAVPAGNYNVRFLRACPMTQALEYCLPLEES